MLIEIRMKYAETRHSNTADKVKPNAKTPQVQINPDGTKVGVSLGS